MTKSGWGDAAISYGISKSGSDDLLRVEQQADRVESLVRKTEEKVRSMIDAADLRFESQRERLRSNQDAEMKDLEDKLMGKLQRALDNPLAD